jgi:integrase/recombinase XerC
LLTWIAPNASGSYFARRKVPLEKAPRRDRAHGIRHSAITTVLDLSGGNVRAAQRFSRHRDLATLLRYDDSREDLAGQMARLAAAL